MEAYCIFSGKCKTSLGTEKLLVDELMQACFSHLHRAIRIDAILSQYGSSLFDRKSPMRYLQIKKGGVPTIDVAQIRKSLSDARSQQGKPINRVSPIPSLTLSDCFGHLLAEYSYRVLTYLVGKVGGLPKMPKEYAIGMVVEQFGQLLVGGVLPELKQHYDREFARVTL